MKIVNTYIVCRITNTIFKTPIFFKVHEIAIDSNSRGYILDDRGVMQVISVKTFQELKNNMLELGL